MKIRSINSCLLLSFIFIFSSCGKKISTLKEFNSYINDAENGLKVTRTVNGVLITVFYTPPEYVAMKEMESNGFKGKEKYDSLLNNNQSSAYFLMVFGPDESKGNNDDIMYSGLKDYKEYVERAITLNFDLEQQITLSGNNEEFMPVLSSLENTYGLSKDRKVNLVFTSVKGQKNLKDITNYDFVYSDETYHVGILHFEFDKMKTEKNLPEIVIQ